MRSSANLAKTKAHASAQSGSLPGPVGVAPKYPHSPSRGRAPTYRESTLQSGLQPALGVSLPGRHQLDRRSVNIIRRRRTRPDQGLRMRSGQPTVDDRHDVRPHPQTGTGKVIQTRLLRCSMMFASDSSRPVYDSEKLCWFLDCFVRAWPAGFPESSTPIRAKSLQLSSANRLRQFRLCDMPRPALRGLVEGKLERWFRSLQMDFEAR